MNAIMTRSGRRAGDGGKVAVGSKGQPGRRKGGGEIARVVWEGSNK